jgi:hypothetical protein
MGHNPRNDRAEKGGLPAPCLASGTRGSVLPCWDKPIHEMTLQVDRPLLDQGQSHHHPPPAPLTITQD